MLFHEKAATQPHKNAFRPTTRRCALCEVEFEAKNLGFTVSQNAIHRLRSRWGAPSTAAARSVATLYNAAVDSRLARATELDYSNLGWGDAEAVSVSKLLASTGMASVTVLRCARFLTKPP